MDEKPPKSDPYPLGAILATPAGTYQLSYRDLDGRCRWSKLTQVSPVTDTSEPWRVYLPGAVSYRVLSGSA